MSITEKTIEELQKMNPAELTEEERKNREFLLSVLLPAKDGGKPLFRNFPK